MSYIVDVRPLIIVGLIIDMVSGVTDIVDVKNIMGVTL